MSDLQHASFDQLHETVQRWIWNRGWLGLRDIQQEAIAAVLSESSDLIISAATASGKTEAVFLHLLATRDGERWNWRPGSLCRPAEGTHQ